MIFCFRFKWIRKNEPIKKHTKNYKKEGKNSCSYYYLYNYFIKKINNVKKYNLDEESLFIELKAKVF